MYSLWITLWTPVEPPVPRPKLEHPLIRRILQEELAHGGKSQTELAKKHGVAQQSISEFAARHAATIQEIRDNAADEFAGLAIARKQARLEVYRELLDKAMTPVPKTAGKGELVYGEPDANGVASVIYEIDAGVAAKLLRNVAEELGHLPNRVTVGGELGVVTNYRVEGVDPGALK